MELDRNKIEIDKAVWNNYQGMSKKEKKSFKDNAPSSIVAIISKLESAEDSSAKNKEC